MMSRRWRSRTRRRYRGRRSRGKALRIPKRNPRLQNLQSKLVVFRLRQRISIEFDPTQVEGGFTAISPVFGNLTATEYARGREEIVQFMRVNFAGLCIYIKKAGDEDNVWCTGTDARTAIALDRKRTNTRTFFMHDLFVDTSQINNNSVTQETVAGTKRIGWKGTKCYKYIVPRTLQSGKGQYAGPLFPSAKPNWTWPILVQTFSGENNSYVSIPDQYFLVLDSAQLPTIPLDASNVVSRHRTTLMVHTYYYFRCYGKRSNV